MAAAVSMSPGGRWISEREHMVLVAGQTATESGGAFTVDTAAELLRTIAEVLDIRSVFPRVSQIVKQVLPHDALELMFHDRAGQVTPAAMSTCAFPGLSPVTSTADTAPDFRVVGDVRTAQFYVKAPPAL